jgi:hypothetical protein
MNHMETELIHHAPVPPGPVAKSENLRLAYVLSTIAGVLSAAASAVGLLFPAVYRGNWGGMSLANDGITLVVVVPTLALAIIYSARGSVRARLLWLGTLFYMLYNYAFYIFGISVTKLYVPWITIFALSAVSVALIMLNLDVAAIGRAFSPRTPGRWIAAYLAFAGVMISVLWISQWLKFVWTGQVPEVNGSQDAYHVIAAVDLTFAVPLLISSACLLFRRRPWGYVLGVAASVQFALYFAVMTSVCVVTWRLTPGSRLISDWFINCIITLPILLLCLAGLLLHVKREAASS